MSAHISLRKQQIADLESLSNLGADRLDALIQLLDGDGPPPLRPSELGDLIQSAVADERVTIAIMRATLSLYGLVRRAGFSVKEIVEGLTEGLRPPESDWTDDQFATWRTVESSFESLLKSRAVRAVAKATDLSYDYANLFQSGRILADIRPVFSEEQSDDGLTIDGAVVSFTLRINYDCRGKEDSLSLAMDYRDVESLLFQCERALKKSGVIQNQLAEFGRFPSIVSGTDDDS